jgi:DNA polymerase III epsilon subunit family exonuclease
MNKPIEEVEFTIFDTETTGLSPESGDRIAEIAGVRFKGNTELAAFQTLVDPQRAISEAAFAVNGITQKMLSGAPAMPKIIPPFLDFIQNSCLCSYNAPFDLAFLNHELKLAGYDLAKDIVVVDILAMARRLLPGLGRYALGFVAESLAVKTKQSHRAAADVELTWKVFRRLLDLLKGKNIGDFHSFLSLFSLNSNLLQDLNNQKIATIEEAIGLGVKLKIKYLARSNAEVSEREVIPKEITQDRKYSYLVGFCCLRNQERTFRVDGILNVEII